MTVYMIQNTKRLLISLYVKKTFDQIGCDRFLSDCFRM